MSGAAATAASAWPTGSPARASRHSTASSRIAIPSGVAPWTGTPHRSVMVVLIRPGSLAWAVLHEYAGSAGRRATGAVGAGRSGGRIVGMDLQLSGKRAL